MAHVVAVAHVGELQPAQVAEAFLQREEIGERLAGMKFVRERVDHGNVGVGGEIVERFLREDARHDALHPALEIFRDVANRLAFGQLRAGVIEKNGRAAEIGDARLEGHARAQRGLFEDQHEHAGRRETCGSVRDAPSFPRPSGRNRAAVRGLHSVPVSRSFFSESGVITVSILSTSSRPRRPAPDAFPAAGAGAGHGFADLAARASTASNFLRNSATSRARMMNGGSRRRMWSCVQLMSRPLAALR